MEAASLRKVSTPSRAWGAFKRWVRVEPIFWQRHGSIDSTTTVFSKATTSFNPSVKAAAILVQQFEAMF